MAALESACIVYTLMRECKRRVRARVHHAEIISRMDRFASVVLCAVCVCFVDALASTVALVRSLHLHNKNAPPTADVYTCSTHKHIRHRCDVHLGTSTLPACVDVVAGSIQPSAPSVMVIHTNTLAETPTSSQMMIDVSDFRLIEIERTSE